MPYLGTVGNIYMGFLLIVLVIGLGLLARKLVSEQNWTWAKTVPKNNNEKSGGIIMFNKWFKLALVSFLGIIISGFALGLMNSTSFGTTGMQGMHGNMNTAMPMAADSNASMQQQMNLMMQMMNQMMMRMDNMMANTGNMNSMNTGGMGMMNMPMMGNMGGGMGMMNMSSPGASSGGSMSSGMSSGSGSMSGGGGMSMM